MRATVKRIVEKGFCLGCGLCEDYAKPDCKMILGQNGFYVPDNLNIERNVEKKISKCCPGINVEIDKSLEEWGKVVSVCDAWSTDDKVRFFASSGGAISAISIFLLETKKVDAILHVGNFNDNSLYNKLLVSKSREEIIHNSSSRYAPALIFSDISKILSNTEEVYAFIGKPCDIATLKNYLKYKSEFKDKIRLFISFFCAGMPSYNGTLKLLEETGLSETPMKIKYRGGGWPGNFRAEYSNGYSFQKSYMESWGDVLGKYIHFRCKICPDGIGLSADIVVADSWKTKNGYPDFEDKEGRSLVICRNEKSLDIVKSATQGNYICTDFFDLKELPKIQPYQSGRIRKMGWRILGVQLRTLFFLSFKGAINLKRMMKINLIKGLKICIGTIVRYGKI
jgi:coenzyme F420 hydrogenase subunit beta